MSSIVINIPDDNWINAIDDFKPEDKALCVVLHHFGNGIPTIMQYRKEIDLFLNISEYWYFKEMGCSDNWEESYSDLFPDGFIGKWKPLGLPKEDEIQILKDIDKMLKELHEE